MRKNQLLLFAFLLLFSAVISAFSTGTMDVFRCSGADTTSLPSLVKAIDHQAKNTVAKKGLITLATGLDNDYYLLDSASRRGYLYTEIKMDRFVNEVIKKVPLNLSIVIDRSGSMSGEKMEFAKKAAAGIIDRLSPNDFVSVVIYDEFIDVVQTSTPVLFKDSIKAKLAKIKPRGSTNLWGGSEKGYEQVKASYRKNYVNRVLLISDGNITAGVKIPSRIIEKVQEYKDIDGITISTFGVGLDYNETLMTAMAENGSGNYYFIDKADKMTAMFNKELNGLQNLVAQNAELRIALPKGVTVEKGYPFKYALVKNEVVIKFQDIFSEERKSLVLQFRIESNASKELMFQTKLVYINAIDNQPESIQTSNLLVPTKNAEAYLTHFNKAVAEQVVLFAANENMENAMYEVDRGHYEAARRLIEATGSYFKIGSGYVAGSIELQKMDSLRRYYTADLNRLKAVNNDTLKLIQKTGRATNYQIRNKKESE
jgi:Ca-activated chloride channel family protein